MKKKTDSKMNTIIRSLWSCV